MEGLYRRIAVLAVRGDFFQYGILRLLYLPGFICHPAQSTDQCGDSRRGSHRSRAHGTQGGGCACQAATRGHLCCEQRLQHTLRPDNTASGHQGTCHSSPSCHACGLHGRDNGPLLPERYLAGISHIQQSLYGFDGRRRRRLSADKAHGDTDICQGTGHLEQPDSHRSRKNKRLYPMEIACHPDPDITYDGKDVQQGVSDRKQSAGKIRSLEFIQKGTQNGTYRRFQHLERMHEPLAQLGGSLCPQSLSGVLLYKCQFRRNSLGTSIMGTECTQPVVITDKHHSRIPPDFSKNSLHVRH